MTIDERIEFLIHSIESHDRQIGGLTTSVSQLVAVKNQDAEAIRALVRVAELPERRIGDLETGA